jgi:hypothetical protein
MKELRKAFIKKKIKGKLKAFKITADDDGQKYIHDHVTYFFDVISYEIISSFSQQDKERYFKMVTDHEKMITNLYGNSMLNSVVFLPVALRKGVNNQLIQEYKTWLDKQ